MNNNSSWDLIRSQVRQFRTNLQTIYPIQVLSLLKDFYFDANNFNLYFLSNNHSSTNDLTPPTRHLNLYCIHINEQELVTLLHNNEEKEDYLTSASNLPVLESTIVFTDYTITVNDIEEKTKILGVSAYEKKDNIIMFTHNNHIYVGQESETPKLIPHNSINTPPPSPLPPPPPNTIPNSTTMDDNSITLNSRLDPKLGGKHNGKISFIRNSDIWITDFHGNELQLTYCSLSDDDPTLKCGIAEYMMQEEFHRFTGYFWCPNQDRILYLETTEKDVELIIISSGGGNNNGSHESIRYPRTGKPNAKSVLKIVEFNDDNTVVHKSLWEKDDLYTQFPWMEYIVRFGWLPGGESIWVQILSRDQKRTAVVKLYASQFTSTVSKKDTANIEILWQENNSNWINITDVYYFINSNTFIWSSEMDDSGYRHLYLVEKYPHQSTSTIKQLTRGDWCCIDRPLYVDQVKHLVYFSAKKETSLESHFYVLNYLEASEEPVLLTRKGYSHTITMNSPDYFIDSFSTLHEPQVTLIRSTTGNKSALLAPIIPLLQQQKQEEEVYVKPSASAAEAAIALAAATETILENDIIALNGVTTTDTSAESALQSTMDLINTATTLPTNGEIFSFTTSDGLLLYGCLYKPKDYKPDKSYPTILHIYGGPKTQLVMNDFKFPRLMRYLMSVYFGFAVVIIDSRGSSDRGLQFESHIKNKLGRVELQDQIEGLHYLEKSKFGSPTKAKSVIDPRRIAITGWSYGGYLSLMALAHYSNVFKMAIAGAPVTQWELYDAAYTERYMGLPKDHAQEYHDSSILSFIDKFPEGENRLLIAHGLIDENVHFKNTELLVSELVKHNKPHYLQVYPSEKHGLRHASVNEHFETLMFYWLVNYL